MSTAPAPVVKGPGLARGPAFILGVILAAIGLALFLHAGDTPTDRFPGGDATGRKIFGVESNGWTAWFTTAAGVLLLLGAAQHLLAKTMSLLVGLALAACALIALFHSPGVLGLAAANHVVELGWGIAAILLLLNVFVPRPEHAGDGRRHERGVGDAAVGERGVRERGVEERGVEGRGVHEPGVREPAVREPAEGRAVGEPGAGERGVHEPVAGTPPTGPTPAGEEPAADEPGVDRPREDPPAAPGPQAPAPSAAEDDPTRVQRGGSRRLDP